MATNPWSVSPVRMVRGGGARRQRSFGAVDPDFQRRRVRDRIENRTLGDQRRGAPTSRAEPDADAERRETYHKYVDTMLGRSDIDLSQEGAMEKIHRAAQRFAGYDDEGAERPVTDEHAKREAELARQARLEGNKAKYWRHRLSAERLQESAPARQKAADYRERMSEAERAKAEEVRKAKEAGTWKGGIIRDPRTGNIIPEEEFEEHMRRKRYGITGPTPDREQQETMKQKAVRAKAALVENEQSAKQARVSLQKARQTLENATDEAERRKVSREVADLERQLDELGERSRGLKATMDAAQSQAENPTMRQPSATMQRWEALNRAGVPHTEGGLAEHERRLEAQREAAAPPTYEEQVETEGERLRREGEQEGLSRHYRAYEYGEGGERRKLGPEEQPFYWFLPPEEADVAKAVEEGKARSPEEMGRQARQRESRVAATRSFGSMDAAISTKLSEGYSPEEIGEMYGIQVQMNREPVSPVEGAPSAEAVEREQREFRRSAREREPVMHELGQRQVRAARRAIKAVSERQARASAIREAKGTPGFDALPAKEKTETVKESLDKKAVGQIDIDEETGEVTGPDWAKKRLDLDLDVEETSALSVGDRQAARMYLDKITGDGGKDAWGNERPPTPTATKVRAWRALHDLAPKLAESAVRLFDLAPPDYEIERDEAGEPIVGPNGLMSRRLVGGMENEQFAQFVETMPTHPVVVKSITARLDDNPQYLLTLPDHALLALYRNLRDDPDLGERIRAEVQDRAREQREERGPETEEAA